jgi:glycosyltransferase involved in cell wall biosynthesis
LRILQVITPSKVAGAERSTASLCEHLAAAGHSVTVACKQDSPFVAVLRELPLDVRPLRIAGKTNVAAAVRLARLAREVRAEVVHTHLSTAAVWGSVAARLAGVPAVAHVRALNSKGCYLLADRIIAVSAAVRDHLVEQGMEGDRIDVVYTGMDPRRYYAALDRGAARRQLDLPAEALAVGVVAHLSQRKGHPVFLEAFAGVAARFPAAVAVLAGDGPDRKQLEAQAASLGIGDRVRFLGFLPDILPVYAALDVVALPAITGEGLPRNLLEGGFLGLPAIGTRLSGVPEIIADGETGYVVPTGDAPALADRLTRLFADPVLRARLGRAAQAKIRSQFTLDAMLAGTLRSYWAAGVDRKPA